MQVNPQQFKIWHDQYRPRLLNSMTALVRNRETAEDITAAAFAAALQHLESFRGESSFYTWLYRIATNEAHSRRRRQPTRSLESFQQLPVELREPDRVADQLDRSTYRAKLQQAMDRVPPHYRRVLTDHLVRGHSVKRIARRRRIPVGTVLSRIFTAKRLLREAWG